MIRFIGLAAAAVASTAAIASPQIPTPANPFPAQPIATDGSPLPSWNVHRGWAAEATGALQSGRSAYAAPRR